MESESIGVDFFFNVAPILSPPMDSHSVPQEPESIGDKIRRKIRKNVFFDPLDGYFIIWSPKGESKTRS